MSVDSDLLYEVPGKCAIDHLFRNCYQGSEGEETVSQPAAYRSEERRVGKECDGRC